MDESTLNSASPLTVYILSGGTGASGEQLVHTVLAQFPENQVRVITIPHLRTTEQLEEILEFAQARHATIVHTLVDHELRLKVFELSDQMGIVSLDLMGNLIRHLEDLLGKPALEQPGLYRQLNKAYFERVAAIEYTMSHDDGQRAETWPQADIILVGASRVGKTPLSLYLSVLGWKVANVPLIPELGTPHALLELDWKRVFGLWVEPTQLMQFRKERQRRLGTSGPSNYTHPQKIVEELDYVKNVCRQASITIIDATDKPIETSADEILLLMDRRFGTHRRQG